ncbi:hypothetical protein VTK73DRAFT_9907 [Phialemonium thermophilum]|uniref:Isochorismatase-like domain-containing protein n=1 Tax=Phialemonium thermophilum TaxID=223376 RepID=A0ABR3XIE2_9PEZI
MASARSLLGIASSNPTTDNSVLVIIDAQNEYAQGKLAVTNVSSSRAVIASLLERYRNAKAPIVHIVHVTPEGAPIFTPGTELAREFEELTPKEGESVVKKHFPGSFTETPLQDLLEETGRRSIVLVGYMAHVCVSTTARQGHERGWDVTVVEDGIGDRDIAGVGGAELTRVVLAELADFFATVVKSSKIV